MCNSCMPRIPADMAKAEAFASQMINILNSGSLSTMISIGHRTGLFDALDSVGTATLEEIAKGASLNERYVKEWLGAMVSGKIIEYDPSARTYHLPSENAIFLTRRSREKNMAAIASMLPVWSRVEDRIVECFKHGGGVGYDEYGRFHEVMGEISHANVGCNLVDNILPDRPGLLDKLEKGIRVLDIGCGDGQVLLKLAERFPGSLFIGVELCEGPVSTARQQAGHQALDNVRFENADLLSYQPVDRFDLITAFDVIHDLAFPDKVLSRCHQWLKDDGEFLMMDVNASSHLENNLEHPFAPFLYTASTLHCMTVSLAQGGMGLGTVWGVEKASEMLMEAGFELSEVKTYEHDPLNNYYFCSRQE